VPQNEQIVRVRRVDNGPGRQRPLRTLEVVCRRGQIHIAAQDWAATAPLLFNLQATDVSVSLGLRWAGFSGEEAVRFLVDLYRLLLFAGLALALIAASYAVSLSFGQSGSLALGGYVLGAVIAGAIFIIFGLGMTATFISIHDRLAEIANNSERIARALEQSSSPASGGDL
jgi:uncharacterized membrane protein YeiB